MPRDLALSFDAASRRFDLVLDAAARNLALDATPASAMIMSVLCDRRARDDDDFPSPADPATPPLDVRLNFFQQKYHAYLAFRRRHREAAGQTRERWRATPRR